MSKVRHLALDSKKSSESKLGFPTLLFSVVLTTLVAAMLLPLASLQRIEAWSADPNVNTPVCTIGHSQDRPVIVGDISGGAIIAWQDSRKEASYDWDIYAQRLDSQGMPLWTDNGVAICTDAGNQWYPAMVADDSGGAIIAWNDDRGGTGAVYAQRVDSAGVPQWAVNGLAVCASVNHKYGPAVISDLSGGAIVVWVHWSSYAATVYAQRVSPCGTTQWEADGVAICSMTSGEEYPYPDVAVADDGSGGAIVTWQNYSSGSWGIRAQRIDSAGVLQWNSGGIAIGDAAGKGWFPDIVSDGSHGAVIAWSEFQSGSLWDIRAQKVDSAGTRQWTDNGTTVCTAVYEGNNPIIVGDGSGGAIITWSNAYWNETYGFSHIYAQRIDASGATKWGGECAAVCTYPCDQRRPVAINDSSGGAIIAWHDDRSHHPPPAGWSSPEVYDIYAQRVDSAGTMLWTDNGTPVCLSAQFRSAAALATDGSGGAIVAWNDQRTTGYENEHIYAQMVNGLGVLGSPLNGPPDQPLNVWPPDSAADVSLTPLLQSSVFSDSSGDLHAASQWQLRTASGTYCSAVFDSFVEGQQLESVAVPEGTLADSTVYYWRVRYLDSHGYWSAWSVETSFSTIFIPNQVPNRPGNVLPANGSSGLGLTPTMQSSDFSDPDAGDTHTASQWRITTTAGDYLNPVFDSNSDNTNLLQIAVPSGKLIGNITYYWQVRHQDNHEDWSDWSAETSFATRNRSPNQPTNAAPASGTVAASVSTALQSSAFSDPDTGDTHTASQWRITTSAGDYSNPVFDSSSDSTNLLQTALPSGKLIGNTTYYWQVRHLDSHGGWSDWSAETSFSTGNQAPDKPTAAYVSIPADIVTVTPILQCSPFSDPDAGDTHAASQWRITATTGDYSTPVFDSGTDNVDLLYIPIPSGVLESHTTYYWQVRHQDNHGDWSEWSLEYSFTTRKEPQSRSWIWIVVGVGGALVITAGAIGIWRLRSARKGAAAVSDGGNSHGA